MTTAASNVNGRLSAASARPRTARIAPSTSAQSRRTFCIRPSTHASRSPIPTNSSGPAVTGEVAELAADAGQAPAEQDEGRHGRAVDAPDEPRDRERAAEPEDEQRPERELGDELLDEESEAEDQQEAAEPRHGAGRRRPRPGLPLGRARAGPAPAVMAVRPGLDGPADRRGPGRAAVRRGRGRRLTGRRRLHGRAPASCAYRVPPDVATDA